MIEKIGVKGRLSLLIETPDPDACIIEGFEIKQDWVKDPNSDEWKIILERDNAFLDQGLQAIIRRYASIAAIPAAPTGIGVSSDNAAVVAGTTQFGGTFRYSVFDATFPSIAGNVGSFQSSFTKGAGAGQIDFSVRKIGITNAAADTAGAVQDIIGGAGIAPYNEPIIVDLIGATSFTFRPKIEVTLTAI